jgi:ATP-dependent helicase/nuclease subunit B
LRSDVEQALTEVKGNLVLKVGETDFILSARADRIDIFSDGKARIIDFKTGTLPSIKQVNANFSPQLTLEAAMLKSGAFEGLNAHETRDLTYIRITGGVPPGEVKQIEGFSIDTAQEHLASLIGLLNSYQKAEQAFLPRYRVNLESANYDYDHLSRYREWILAGDS